MCIRTVPKLRLEKWKGLNCLFTCFCNLPPLLSTQSSWGEKPLFQMPRCLRADNVPDPLMRENVGRGDGYLGHF